MNPLIATLGAVIVAALAGLVMLPFFAMAGAGIPPDWLGPNGVLGLILAALVFGFPIALWWAVPGGLILLAFHFAFARLGLRLALFYIAAGAVSGALSVALFYWRNDWAPPFEFASFEYIPPLAGALGGWAFQRAVTPRFRRPRYK